MKVILALLTLIRCSNVIAQTDTSYHLLWYQGKKIKPNVLLTPAGDTVRYDVVKGTIKVTSSKGSGNEFDNMQAELGKTNQRMQEMLQHVSYLPKVMLPQVSVSIKKAFTEADEDYRKLLSNTLVLPDKKLFSNTTGGKGMSHDLLAVEEDWGEIIAEFRDYIEKHSDDNLSNLPEPPKFDFTYCFACDIDKKNAYKKQLAEFMEALMGKEEIEIKEKALAASKKAVNAGLLQDHVQREVGNLLEFLAKRSRLKLNKLVERYINDPERAMAIVEVSLATEREQQIMGFGSKLPDYAAQAFAGYVKRIEKALAEYDYPVALNHSLVLLYERKMQLYNYKIQSYGVTDKVLKFNVFKMHTNISAKASGDGGYVLAGGEGDNWLSTYVDSSCQLKWYLIGPNKNKLQMMLTEAEMKGSGGGATYAGSRTWLANPPQIKLNFCNEEKQDSIITFPFYAEDHKEYWNFPNGPMNVLIANGVLLGCFVDVERTKEDVAEFKADPAKIEKLKQQMMAQYQKFANAKGGYSAASAAMDINQLTQIANSTALGRDVGEIVDAVNPGRYIFTPVVHNKDRMIIKDRMDGKVIFPQNTATEHAIFDITIEQDPQPKFIP